MKHPAEILLLRGLTHFERNVLQWLARQDRIPLDNCDCEAIQKLVELGLATTDNYAPPRVRCTEGGYAVARMIGGDT